MVVISIIVNNASYIYAIALHDFDDLSNNVDNVNCVIYIAM